MGAAKKSTCKHGHRMVGWNLYQRKDGTRECKRCSLLRTAIRDGERKKQRQAARAARRRNGKLKGLSTYHG